MRSLALSSTGIGARRGSAVGAMAALCLSSLLGCGTDQPEMRTDPGPVPERDAAHIEATSLDSAGAERAGNIEAGSNDGGPAQGEDAAASPDVVQVDSPADGSAADGLTAMGGKVLIFSRTTRVRHDHIPTAVKALEVALQERGLTVSASEDPQWFVAERLRELKAVILLSTTGTPLGDPGTQALRDLDAYVKGGGILIGLHAASSTLYEPGLPYTQLIGGKFENHPGGIRTANCHRIGSHPAVIGLPEPFITKDEIYVMSQLRPENEVILTCDAVDGKKLPIAWHRSEGAGRVFYTALGHEVSDWARDSRFFVGHALPGILWALRP